MEAASAALNGAGRGGYSAPQSEEPETEYVEFEISPMGNAALMLTISLPKGFNAREELHREAYGRASRHNRAPILRQSEFPRWKPCRE